MQEASQAFPFEVVVVCNGCTDATAQIALKFPRVTVIEVSEPSKIAALNAGDEAVTTFPRIYLDADSEISNQSAQSLLRAAYRHAAPAIFSAAVTPDTSRCTALARSFARCAQRTSFGEFGVVGRGIYTLNAAGRTRFGRFPGLTGDDFFVASLFAADEQVIDQNAQVVVRPPADLRSLVRVRSRVYYGNKEGSSDKAKNVSPHRGWRNVTYALRRVRSLGEIFDLFVYVGVNLAAKRMAVKMARSGFSPQWQRDDSSR
jgi:glycosyltransferase involved in cell wall biosynthesis